VRRDLSILCAVALAAFVLALGRGAVTDADEAYYAEAAREMVESGDWTTPTFNYEPRFQKPILYYWLAAAAYEVGGVSAFAARLPSALSGLGLVAVAWLVGRRWINARTGLLAGLVTASNFGYVFMARAALPDLPLAFFVTLATWSGCEWLAVGTRTLPADESAGDPRRARGWLLLASAAMALGFLMKGPVAVILPVGVVVIVGAALWWADGRRPRMAWFDPLVAVALFVALAAPWFVAMVDVHGTGYLERFFVGENVERFATERYNDPRPFWYYVPILLGGLLPWTGVLVLWLPRTRRVLTGTSRITAVEWTLIAWAVVPLVFYSISIGKQPRYVLPCLPPLAVLVAATIDKRLAALGDRPVDRGLAWAATLGGVVILLAAALVFRARPLLFALNPVTGDVALIVLVLAGAALVAAAWLQPSVRLSWWITGTALAAFLSLHVSVNDAAGVAPVERMGALVAQHVPPGARLGTHRVFVRNLIFYTGRRTEDLSSLDALVDFLASPQPAYAVVRAGHLRELERDRGVRPVVVAGVRHFDPALVRLGTLLRPNPARHVDEVLLVRN